MAYPERFRSIKNELEWLYMELYDNRDMLASLESSMEKYASERKNDLRKLDERRIDNPKWYLDSSMVAETMYTNLFAGTFKGIADKVSYLRQLGITYLHLMPFMKTPEKDNDGGFAVSDFLSTDDKLGTVNDVENLADVLRDNGISLCMDFVMNHTSDEHEWAIKAKKGDKRAQEMYITFPDRTIPDAYEKTVPEVFPETAPGNFIYSEEMGRWVLSTFYPKQWDLNYHNPAVFNSIVSAMMFWANKGVEVFRLDAVPYIWKELGTNCRNLPNVHTIVRMIRIILETVAPATILKGEVVMAPKELAAYFGTSDKPECHILYGVSSMVNIWGALASEDIRLLKYQIEDLLTLPPHASFVNYVRCHDDIGWGFDENKESEIGIDPLLHKIYQYQFWAGKFPGSYAKGGIYNYDEKTLDARTVGTTASLIGLESYESDEEKEKAISRFRLIYSTVFALKGLPLINSGDEIGMLNDESYMLNKEKKDDSRYLHRPFFDWDKANNINLKGTVENRLFSILKVLEGIRKGSSLFSPDAEVFTWDSHNDKVFALRRRDGEKVLLAVFNYSHETQHAHFDYFTGIFKDLLTGKEAEPGIDVELSGYDVLFLTNYCN